MLGSFKVELQGLDNFLNGLMHMQDQITPESLALMESAAEETKGVMQENIPDRTGSLSSSIDFEVRDEGNIIIAEVGPNDANFAGRSVGRATELGLSSGQAFPPADVIADRYGLSLGVGFLVARSIYEHGSGGLFYAEKTLEVLKGIMLERGISMVREIASQF